MPLNRYDRWPLEYYMKNNTTTFLVLTSVTYIGFLVFYISVFRDGKRYHLVVFCID